MAQAAIDSSLNDVNDTIRRAQLELQRVTWPQHLKDSGSRFYRSVTFKQLDAATRSAVGFKTPEQVAHWLLTHGPVRIRCRWHNAMTKPDHRGRVDVAGVKGGRVTCVLMGYDAREPYGFRLLTPFGSAFGEIGRVWVSTSGLRRLIKEGAKLDAPVLG